MTAGPGPDQPPRSAVRRRVASDDGASREGRTGCIVLGAVIGVIAGILFTFFGLPPLLNHFFGETDVAVGDSLDADGKVVRVVAVHRQAEAWEVVLSATANKTWRPEPGDFELELAGGQRVTAAAPASAIPATSLEFILGQPRDLSLRFPIGSEAALPNVLHLARPQVAFDLPAPSPP